MKVLLISSFPPSPHNIGGPSALPYYLSKYKIDKVKKIDLIYFEGYEDKENYFLSGLPSIYSNIKKIRRSNGFDTFIYRILRKLNIKFKYIGCTYIDFPQKAIINEIIKEKYDLIWIYPNTMYAWYDYLKSNYKVVVTGPDCASLSHKLVDEIFTDNDKKKLELKGSKNSKKRSWINDINWSKSNALIHTVGKEDNEYFKIMGANEHSFFSLHPVSTFETIKKNIVDTTEKLTIVITGVNYSIYMGFFLDKIVDQLLINNKLNEFYKIIFIGKNFEQVANKLIKSGYEINYLKWVDSYEKAISEAQIQILPIIFGSGTKGKTLCAMASGLLCIGTKFAFENIEINTNEDCILINNEMEVVDSLFNIIKNKEFYVETAKNASKKVIEFHNPIKTSELFWNSIVHHFNL